MDEAANSTHTPGPLHVEHSERWPFDVLIVDAQGVEIERLPMPAHASAQRTVADCMAAFGFPPKQVDEVVAMNARKLADARLWAAAPDLLRLLIRYRTETPLGHQPHMIAHEADAVIAKALGQ